MYNEKNLTGQKFGMLTVEEKTNKRMDNGSIVWKCRCDCGKVGVEVSSKRLVNGITVSCGCYQKERQRYSMQKLQGKSNVENTNLELLKKSTPNKNSTTGVRGVYWSSVKNRYVVTLVENKKNHFIGNFKKEDFDKAVAARKEAEKKYFKPILDKYKE